MSGAAIGNGDAPLYHPLRTAAVAPPVGTTAPRKAEPFDGLLMGHGAVHIDTSKPHTWHPDLLPLDHPLVGRRQDKAERDPTGRAANEPGAKLDAGKNRLGLVLGGFPRALLAVGRVGTYGANKYTDNGWQTVPNGFARYTDAMLRHQVAEFAGETYDPETDIEHAAHACWNCLARLELMLREREVKK